MHLSVQKRVGKYFLRRRYTLSARVDPFTIVYAKRRDDWPGYLKRWPLLCCPGNWDQYRDAYPPFRQQQLEELLRPDVDYQATPWFADLVARLRRDGETRFPRCRSLEDVHDYFIGLRRLHDSMVQQGYKSAAAHGGEGEIQVRVSRNGELLKCGQGTHRLAMARILRLPWVIITVDLVHSAWADHCCAQYQAPVARALELWLEAVAVEK